MASEKPLYRFLNADLTESMDSVMTESGRLAPAKSPPKSKKNAATLQRQVAIRDALREGDKLPDEIRLALLACFEDLVLGHVPDLFVSVLGSGRHPSYRMMVAVQSAMNYIASVPEERRRLATAHIARWFKTTEKTIKNSWPNICGPVVAIDHSKARKNALFWSRVFQASRPQPERNSRTNRK